MRKRILSGLLSAVILLSLLPEGAIAAETNSIPVTDFENQFFISSLLQDYLLAPDPDGTHETRMDGNDWTGDPFYKVQGNLIELGNDKITKVKIEDGVKLNEWAFQSIMAVSKFEMDFTRDFYVQGELSAYYVPDGFAIGFQTDPSFKVVGVGGTNGYIRDDSRKLNGAPNGLFFEVDLWGNGGSYGDNGFNGIHRAIMQGDAIGAYTAISSKSSGVYTIDTSDLDGRPLQFKITWNALKKELSVEYGNYSALTANVDPAQLFGSSKKAYLTFASALDYQQARGTPGPIQFKNLRLAYLDFEPECSTRYFVERDGQNLEVTGLDGTSLSDYARAGETITVQHTLKNAKADAETVYDDVRISSLKLGNTLLGDTLDMELVSGSVKLNGQAVANDSIFNGTIRQDGTYNCISVPFEMGGKESVVEYQIKVSEDCTGKDDLNTQVLCGTAGMSQTKFDETSAPIASKPTVTMPSEIREPIRLGTPLDWKQILPQIQGGVYDASLEDIDLFKESACTDIKNAVYGGMTFSVTDQTDRDVTDTLEVNPSAGEYTLTITLSDSRTGLQSTVSCPLILYQEVSVTFKVVNGTWADGTSGNQTVTVTLADGKGTLDSADVPSDMHPNSGYENGHWETEPNTNANAITGDITYIYSFDKVAPPTKDVTVTFRVINGTWADGTSADKAVTVTLTDGKGTLNSADIPVGMVANSGYEDGAWDTVPNTDVDVITENVTYTYSFTRIGTATVTFRVENGKWADGTTEDKTETIPLSSGKGTLSVDDVPTGMTANSGYENGTWDVTPNTAADAITSDVTYTYSFTKQTGGGGGGGTTYYTLTYDTNGGNSIASERHASGTTVKLTKTPTREGYTFTGWFADKALNEKIIEIKMNGSKTIYAGWEKSNVPGDLNGDDHFAYILGRSDGLVHPNDNITRAEVATIFYRLLNEDVRSANETTSNSFSDVSASQWHNTAISTIANLGIVLGRGNGIFDPEAPITRAEFATIAARFDSETYNGADKFPDISGHWAACFINRAAHKGWVQGDTSGNFRPDALITRAEVITMINRVLQRLPESTDDLLSGMKTFSDNMDTSAWYYLAIQEAANGHDYDRKSDGLHEKWTGIMK